MIRRLIGAQKARGLLVDDEARWARPDHAGPCGP